MGSNPTTTPGGVFHLSFNAIHLAVMTIESKILEYQIRKDIAETRGDQTQAERITILMTEACNALLEITRYRNALCHALNETSK